MSRFAAKHTSNDDLAGTREYEHGYSYSTSGYAHISKPGHSARVVSEISHIKQEPAWMEEKRLAAYDRFTGMQLPGWGADLSDIDFDRIHYYLKPTDEQANSWDDVPTEVKETFEKLGIPEAERSVLAGVKAQYDSEVVYGSLQKNLADQGVVFLSMDEGLRQYPELVKEYFGTLIPAGDNMFAALNTAVWSGGSFVYVPPNTQVTQPLQAYFRINAENAGQFERTLIIVDEGARVHYIEGCTAPNFSSGSLHSAVVEIFVKKGAQCQYTTVQNWYKNVYNLVTKRASVDEDAQMIWTDFNMGSKVTMKYPSFILKGRGARGETLSMALAGAGQHQDTGSKAIHLAPHTSSSIISKSISKDGGRTSYRGLVNVGPNAQNAQNTVICDALLLDSTSRSDTYPVDKIFNSQVAIQHEATVSKIGDDQLFYLMSRGVTEETARKMIVNGFVEDLVRKLPF
ncbi:MAG: Fe-S cluster assembly protein SufB, partial [Pseudomonadales bacterium]|nr:Fe-S cluster assembly protein SufB [Pseudomonadales bacterium]